MTALDPTAPELCRFSVRAPQPLWTGLATVVFSWLAAVAGDAADAKAGENTRLPDQQFLSVSTTVAERQRLDTNLEHKVALVDRLCGLTDIQRQKLQLAGRGDIKRFLDRVKEIQTHSSQVENDPDKLKALDQESERLRRGIVEPGARVDELIFVKALEQLLTAEQASKYAPLRAIFRAGGLILLRRRGADELLEINLSGTAFADDGLAHLSQWPESPILSSLNLTGTNVTDLGLAHLKARTKMYGLDLANTRVTDAGLAHLTGLTSLEYLVLDNTPVSDKGLVQLTGLTGLQLLCLSGTQVTDTGLAHLKGLIKLNMLDLNNSQVTDAGLANLKELTNLEWLGLDNARVADAGLAHLTGLTSLQSLWLGNSQVTDAGLSHLKKLSRLGQLGVGNTQVSDAGVAELRRALPRLLISR